MADDEAKYSQAVRFLTSLRSLKNQDIESQQAFLRSKGLSDETIARAFEDLKRPESIADEAVARAAQASEGKGESDDEAFDRAANAFDDPLRTEESQSSAAAAPPPPTPPKTYPRSPLALYHDQTQTESSHANTAAQVSPTALTTRYDVLLAFFRSLCYFLVLGGGVTGMLVALYRTYLLPRMITTLDCRSSLLKHHFDQYSILANRVRSLGSNSLAPKSQQTSAAPRRGVLKKVQFADDVKNEKRHSDEEDRKEAGETDPLLLHEETQTDKAKGADSSSEKDGSSVEDNDASEKANVQKSIDVMESIRGSLARLNQSLKADLSASAIGTAIGSTSVLENSSGATPAAATVEDESDAGSWVSEEDSDELEFDPHTQESSSRRKHGPSNIAGKIPTISGLSARSSSAASLNSSLSTLNAYINSQTYRASAHVFGGSRSISMGDLGNSTAGNGTNGADKAANKAGDVAQIRADIRNLKGLLLSRRNFPIYRPTTSVAAPSGSPQ